MDRLNRFKILNQFNGLNQFSSRPMEKRYISRYVGNYRVIINEWIKEWYGHRHISTGKTVKRYTIRIANVGHLIWNKNIYIPFISCSEHVLKKLPSFVQHSSARRRVRPAIRRRWSLFLLLPISQCTVLFLYCLKERKNHFHPPKWLPQTNIPPFSRIVHAPVLTACVYCG